jgi:hypothetical protein
MRKLLILTFYILSFSFFQKSHARDRIENHQAILLRSYNLQTADIDSETQVFYSDRSRNISINISEAVRDIESHYQPVSETMCQDLDLQIFLLPKSVLNDRSTMRFLRWSDWDNQNIRGVYTSFHVPERGEIYINYEKPIDEFYKILAHELFHFFTDRECMRLDYREIDADRFSESFCDSSNFC